MGVLEGQGDDEVSVVGLRKGKEDIPVWGGFLGSERLSGPCPESVLLVGPVPGACPLKIPHRISIGPGLEVGR